MNPAKGGPGLPPAPVCGAKDHRAAKKYVHTLEEALLQEGWSANQRRYLKLQLLKWKHRAMGMDPYFERRGNIGGSPSAPAPSQQMIVMERWRRDHLRKEREHRAALERPKTIRAEEKEEDREER